MGIDVKILYFSDISKDLDLKLEKRIIGIYQILNIHYYINPVGGR